MKESTIQKRILDKLNALDDTWAVKIITCNRNGTPDILACYQGRFLAIEVKRPGNKLSKLQEFQLNAINETGGLAFVAHSWDEVCEKLTIEHCVTVIE